MLRAHSATQRDFTIQRLFTWVHISPSILPQSHCYKLTTELRHSCAVTVSLNETLARYYQSRYEPKRLNQQPLRLRHLNAIDTSVHFDSYSAKIALVSAHAEGFTHLK